MSTDQVSVFFALLTLGALALGGLATAGTFTTSATGAARLIRPLQPLLVPTALAVAATAVAGSLYYSEVAGYPPCEMCWYQRICMYPLVPILGVASWHGRTRTSPTEVGWCALPLAVTGLGISVYHYQLQLFPGQSSSCDPSAPCTSRWVDSFGFVSIPFMAGCGFVAIIGLTVLSIRLGDDPVPAPGTEAQ